MAKKKETLTLEEKLKQALVKDEDIPYEVPENWIWTVFGCITQVCSGGTPKTNINKYYEGGNIPWITPADLSNYQDVYISQGQRFITIEGLNNSSARLLPKDTILMSSRAPIGYIAIANNEVSTNQGFKSFLPSKAYISKYVYYYLIYSKEFIEGFGSGTTFKEISGKKAAEIPICIPPISEQQRIVNIIENLFEKLDRAKELVQNALDSFENRKAAILHKGFTGELTAKWREENRVSLDSWKEYELKDLVTKLNQGWSPKCEDFPTENNEEWGVIKTTAIQHMEFIEKENKQLPKDLEPREKHELKEGDILITRAGPRIRVGVCCLVKAVRPKLLLCDKAYRFRAIETKILSEYIVFTLNTVDILDKINKMKTGISESGVNLTQNGFLAIRLKVPSIIEQKEITRILDNFLQHEQRAKELYDVIEKIDMMKKSILARAFRGELGTNNPKEESALELLKEILS